MLYSIIGDEEFVPISHFQQDDRQYCFLMFEKVLEDAIPTVRTILIHLAHFPTRIGNPTPFDGCWYLTANQPMIGGHQITMNLFRMTCSL